MSGKKDRGRGERAIIPETDPDPRSLGHSRKLIRMIMESVFRVDGRTERGALCVVMHPGQKKGWFCVGDIWFVLVGFVP